MKLNKSQCGLAHAGGSPNVHFADGSAVPKTEDPGCSLNRNCAVCREVKASIGRCVGIVKKLDLLWRHSDCPQRFKLTVLDGVIWARALYGLESAHMNESESRRLTAFQFKGLQKFLRLETTSISRGNTNQLVLEKANEAIQGAGGASREVKTFAAAHHERRLVLIEDTLRAGEQNLLKMTTLQPHTVRHFERGTRRAGRPKSRWATDALKAYGAALSSTLREDLGRQTLDLDDRRHVAEMKAAAQRQAIRGRSRTHRRDHADHSGSQAAEEPLEMSI